MRALWSDSALVLGSRSTGLSTTVQEPRARFYVVKWGVFFHSMTLQNHPARFNQVYSDSTLAKPIHAPAQPPQSRQQFITCNFWGVEVRNADKADKVYIHHSERDRHNMAVYAQKIPRNAVHLLYKVRFSH